MPHLSQVLFTSVIICISSVQGALGFASPAISSKSLLSPSVSTTSNSQCLSHTLDLYGDVDHVRNLEAELVHFSKIVDEDIRRNDFELFVTGRLKEELDLTKIPIKTIDFKRLTFVKAVNESILKLVQSVQNESHAASGFQPVSRSGNDIWPYVDMLIQFKLLISNMERMSRNMTTTSAAPPGNGCKCTGCPGFGACKPKVGGRIQDNRAKTLK